jgi:hypothetical protein
LPHVESGVIALIGATTENPSFEINSALLSRVKVFILNQLDGEELLTILREIGKDGITASGLVARARGVERRRRSGQLVSKMRFMSAQLHAYFADGLWIENARRANEAAHRLSAGLAALPGIALAFPVETNLVFATIDPASGAKLEAAGLRFRRRDAKRPAENLFRLVTSFETTHDEVDGILARCRAALA